MNKLIAISFLLFQKGFSFVYTSFFDGAENKINHTNRVHYN